VQVIPIRQHRAGLLHSVPSEDTQTVSSHADRDYPLYKRGRGGPWLIGWPFAESHSSLALSFRESSAPEKLRERVQCGFVIQATEFDDSA